MGRPICPVGTREKSLLVSVCSCFCLLVCLFPCLFACLFAYLFCLIVCKLPGMLHADKWNSSINIVNASTNIPIASIVI